MLSPEAYHVLREEGTESPFTSELNAVEVAGTFVCGGCRAPLFATKTKYDSGSGWPSFYSPIDQSALTLATDYKLVLPRTECRCASCGGHLGHVFEDGPQPTGQRFCVNGVAMDFCADEADPGLAEAVAKRAAAATRTPSPASAVLPGALFNAALAMSFFMSYAENCGKVEASADAAAKALAYFPLACSVFYGTIAARSLRRLLPAPPNSFDSEVL